MPSKTQMRDERLVESFVASFEKLADLTGYDWIDPVISQLAVGDCDQYGRRHWRPKGVITNKELLEPIYSQLPRPFPPLFQRLVLSFRWAEVDIQLCQLLANPPGPDLSGLVQEMSRDRTFWKYLRAGGYIQFGTGPGGDSDPVCFDTSSRKSNGDCKIVKIDHEQILCYDRVKVVAEVAPSFRELMLRAIDKANQT